MRVVYAVIQVLFIGVTIILGLLYRKGNMLFDAGTLVTLKQLVLPGYMILCGVMIGSFLYRGGSDAGTMHTNTGLNTFLLGCGLGVVGALIVIFSQ